MKQSTSHLTETELTPELNNWEKYQQKVNALSCVLQKAGFKMDFKSTDDNYTGTINGKPAIASFYPAHDHVLTIYTGDNFYRVDGVEQLKAILKS